MGKEARKLGSCFIPLAIAAAGLMAGRCTPGIPPSSARHAPEAMEDSDVDLEAVLPLHPEIAASLDAIESESELEALLSIDDQEAIEGVRAGVRLGVRAGIRAGRRAEDTSGVRLGVRLGAQDGVRLAGHRQAPIIHEDTSPETNPLDRIRVPLTLTTEFPTPPSIENRTPDSRKLPSVPPASPPDLSSLGFVAHFRVPPDQRSEGHHNIHLQIRPRMRPDLPLMEVKKKVRFSIQRSAISGQPQDETDPEAESQELNADSFDIEETLLEPDEIDLPDQDGDNVASALEIAARLAGPNRAPTDPMEDAFALATGPIAPDGLELRAALENLAGQFREKVRQTARTAGIPPEEIPDLPWAATDFSPPESAAVADRNIVRPTDKALVMLTCSKTECAFRCSWSTPAGLLANEACKSPLTFQSDQIGEHRLVVASVDRFGTRDLSPVEIVFQVVSDVVCVSESCGQATTPEFSEDSAPPDPAPAVSLVGDDRVPPDTRLTASPPRLTRADTATFDFAASETGATFACGLGLGTPFTCTSPFALIGLKEGFHLFRVFAIDAAGNRDPSPAVHEWLVDRTPPTPGQVVAAGPGESGYLRSTTALSIAWAGFSDEPSGIQAFDVHINTQQDCAGERQGAAEAGLAHSAEAAGLNLLDGTTYFACVRATDRADNAGAWVSSRGITVDVSEPTSAIAQPVAGSKLSALTALGGTAADAISGVAGVGLTIRRETDGLYWDGTNWRNEPAWNKASGGSTFIYSGLPPWESGVRYVIRSRAVDSAGNIESRDTISLFTFDSTPPAFAGATSAGSLANAVRVTWSPATDTVSARLAIRYVLCRSTTTGGCNPFSATTVTPPGATQFDFTGLKANTTYYFVVRARDEAGNVDENLTEVSATTGNAK